MALLEVNELKTTFDTERGTICAVDGISFHIDEGEAVGLVGESGCGKSVTGLSIIRLVASPPGKIVGGSVLFEGQNLLEKTEREMLSVRGAKISMVFQEPMTSLNPVFTVGNQIREAISLHQRLSSKQCHELALEMLSVVGIPNPKERIRSYPHELSGGMRQRVMIAIALACRPRLLIADEPTTALDVTIQAQILDLLKDLQANYEMGVLLISHNLGVIAELTKRVIVMYAGRIVETATIEALYDHAKHPYTLGLYDSLPSVSRSRGVEKLKSIEGVVPELFDLPKGCKFRNRCPKATEECGKEEPQLRELDPGHFVRCIHAD